MAEDEKTIDTTDAVLDPGERKDSSRSRSRDGMLGAFLVLWILSFFSGLAGVIFWRGYSQFGSQMEERARPSITELAAQTPAAPEPVAVPTNGTTNSDAPETPEPTSGTAVAKGELDTRVLNGGAAKGSAATVTELLVKAGFAKAVAGNATGDYQGMAVYCKEGKTAEANALAEALKVTYKETVVKTIPTNVTELAQATCTVVVGAGAR